MSKEFFKTVILNILVFLSLILAFNIWFDKELWSDGYSSFVYSFENIFPFLSDDVYIDNSAISEEGRYGIEWIAVTVNGKRSIVYFGDGDFAAFEEGISGIKSSAVKSGNASEITDDDFKNVFKSGGIAVKFNTPVNISEYFDKESDYFDNTSPETELLLLTLSEDNSATKYMYFKNKKTDTAYRIPLKYNNGGLSELISLRISSASASDSYAFELNFDKTAEGIDRILFDSLVPITIQTKSIYTPKVKTMEYNSQNSFDAVFKAFDIKKNSARSYRDTDNVLNYLETYSSLKITEDGSFSYSTDNYRRGVHIGKSNVTEDVLNFANSLYHNIVSSETILTLKDIKETENGDEIYGLIYSDGRTPLYLNGVYGASVTVKDGYITAYSQKLLALEKSTDAVFTGSVIEAYDSIYKSNLQKGKESLKITKILPVNYYDNAEIKLKWYVEFSDGSAEFAETGAY